MKIQVIKISKPTNDEVKALSQDYLKRTRTLNPIEGLEFKTLEAFKNSKEFKAPSSHWLIALDEKGKQFTSVELSKNLQKWLDNPSIKQLSFLIGGPYGLDEEVRKKANIIYSLSFGTLPSDLAWVLTCEQIYRAFTLIKGMPYHHA